MEITDTQVDFIYKRISKLFPTEMTNYDDNQLWGMIEKLTLQDYKYMLAMSYQKQDDVILRFFGKEHYGSN